MSRIEFIHHSLDLHRAGRDSELSLIELLYAAEDSIREGDLTGARIAFGLADVALAQ